MPCVIGLPTLHLLSSGRPGRAEPHTTDTSLAQTSSTSSARHCPGEESSSAFFLSSLIHEGLHKPAGWRRSRSSASMSSSACFYCSHFCANRTCVCVWADDGGALAHSDYIIPQPPDPPNPTPPELAPSASHESTSRTARNAPCAECTRNEQMYASRITFLVVCLAPDS